MTAMVRATPSTTERESGTQETALLPPHDLDAEAAVLSAVLLNPDALARIEDFLHPQHSSGGRPRQIYEAALEVKLEGGRIDEVTIGARLKERGRLAQVGGMPYLAEIIHSSPVIANVREHAMIVFERWRVRHTMLLCEQAAAHGYGVVDAQSYTEHVSRAIGDISRMRPGERTEGNFDVLRRIVRQLHEGANAGKDGVKGRGIPTGIKSYDEKTLGLFAGQKTTLVAHPRVGKTSLALQIGVNVAQQGIGVAFFSTEMVREEIGDKQLARLARVDSKRIQQQKQKPTLTPDEWRRLAMVMNEAERIRYVLHVFDESGQTVDDICARAKALHEQSLATDGVPLGLVIVDYVQKLRAVAHLLRAKLVDQIRYGTERLKDLAKELKLPVLEIAQAKNVPVDRAKGCRPKPQLGDAADCFQIERSADNVVYVWRPREKDGRHVKLVGVKQRGGEEFEVDLTFEREFSNFDDAPYGPMNSTSRQYVDDVPEIPAGRFNDDDDGSTTLTRGL